MEKKANCASAGVLDSYHAAVIDLRLAPKIRGCSLCLAAILVYPSLTAEKRPAPVLLEFSGQEDILERKERREIIPLYEQRTTRIVSNRHATEFT